MEELNSEARIGNGDYWIAFSPVADRLHVKFSARTLSGAWTTEPVADPRATANELQRLHTELKGTVLLSDNGSLGIHFTAGRRGQVDADIHIEGWPFGVDGSFKFGLPVDHAQLLHLSRSLAGVAA